MQVIERIDMNGPFTFRHLILKLEELGVKDLFTKEGRYVKCSGVSGATGVKVGNEDQVSIVCFTEAVKWDHNVEMTIFDFWDSISIYTRNDYVCIDERTLATALEIVEDDNLSRWVCLSK